MAHESQFRAPITIDPVSATVVSVSPDSELDLSLFNRVLECGDAGRRARLADQIGAFMSAGEVDEHHYRALTGVLARIADDPVDVVRASLTRALSAARRVPAKVVFAIAADNSRRAYRFLRLSPALDCKRMLAIIKAGDDVRKAALARRDDVDDVVIAELVDHGGRGVARALLASNGHRLSARQLERLHARFGADARIAEALLRQPHLPLAVRFRHLRAAGRRLGLFAARAAVGGGGRLIDACEGAVEEAVVDLLSACPAGRELASAVRALCDEDMLTASVLARAACAGRLAVVSACLGHVSGMEAARIERLAGRGGRAPLRSVERRCNLPGVCMRLLECAFAASRCADARDQDLETFGEHLVEAVMTAVGVDEATRGEVLQLVGEYAPLASIRRLAEQLAVPAAKSA